MLRSWRQHYCWYQGRKVLTSRVWTYMAGCCRLPRRYCPAVAHSSLVWSREDRVTQTQTHYSDLQGPAGVGILEWLSMVLRHFYHYYITAADTIVPMRGIRPWSLPWQTNMLTTKLLEVESSCIYNTLTGLSCSTINSCCYVPYYIPYCLP